MLPLTEFVVLELDDQAQYIHTSGTLLLQRDSERFLRTLYAIEKYFVEVWQSKTDDTIIGIISFEDTSRLDAYLKSVSLKGLFC